MSVKRKVVKDRDKFIKYEDLKRYVRENNIRKKDEYLSHVSNNFIIDGINIPYNPSAFYSKEIWEGWSIFLRDEVYKKKYNGTYYSYKECKEAVRQYNFLSKSDYFRRIKDIIKLDIKIPYDPRSVYKEEWEGWVHFLDTDNSVDQIENLVDFEIAREYSRSLNLKFQKQWYKIKFRDLPKGMTKKPEKLYVGKGWIDWNDFLGIDKRTQMSYGEVLIADFFDRNEIKYIYNKSLKDCISSSKLRFDFYLPDFNVCIEFDGMQHFKPVEMFGGMEEFEKLKVRDEIKNKWCEVNGFELIRFNYLQQKEDIYEQLKKFVYK
jgi:hypothetical protein